MAPIQLSPSTFLYPPSEEEGNGANKKSDPSHPRAIVLATWAFAQDAHIAKYVDRYRQRFPSASILVAKCFLRHFFWLPAAREDLAALAVAIRSVVVDDDKDDEPGARNDDDGSSGNGKEAERAKMILHIFSNSGLSTAYQLRNVYEADGRTPFPQRVTIFDSTPGRYEYWSITSSLQFGIPPGRWLQKLVSMPLAHLLSSSLWVWCRVLKGEDWVAKWAAAANSHGPRQGGGGGKGQRETCRSYAYSRADPLVESWVVEAHAADARAKGFTVVHTADFGEGSAHVAHSRADPERYWGLVTDTWETARLARL